MFVELKALTELCIGTLKVKVLDCTYVLDLHTSQPTI